MDLLNPETIDGQIAIGITIAFIVAIIGDYVAKSFLLELLTYLVIAIAVVVGIFVFSAPAYLILGLIGGAIIKLTADLTMPP